MQTPWGDFAVADAHVHFFSRKFFSALAFAGRQDGRAGGRDCRLGAAAEDPAELARAWAAELDGHGVARAALIASVPGDEASVETAVAAVSRTGSSATSW